MEKNISFKKDTKKVLLLQVEELMKAIVKFRAESFWCFFLYNGLNNTFDRL